MTKYRTIRVQFNKPISSLDAAFDDTEIWGCSSVKELYDGYESTRFTQIYDDEAIITSEYNMGFVIEQLNKDKEVISSIKEI
ncbi:MAG: DUF6956 domain-containing protein [Bacteroidales bacterium]